MKTASIIAAASALLLSGMANAAEIKVLSTQATQEAYLEPGDRRSDQAGQKPSPAAASISRNPAPGSRCAKGRRSPTSVRPTH